MGTSLAVLFTFLTQVPQQAPAPAVESKPAAAALPSVVPELVLQSGSGERITAQCGLGDGGFTSVIVGPLHCAPGSATTPGGATVTCRAEGVKIVLPSSRELLFAPDGFLHLRSGEVVGPFAGGLQLHLLDGAVLTMTRNGSRRAPLQSVQVAHGETSMRIWGEAEPRRDPAQQGEWGGDRLWCLGDGGAIYRAVALGPLTTLALVLAPEAARSTTPAARLVLAVEPVLASLAKLMSERPRRVERETSPELRAIVDAAATIFVVDEHAPPRVSRKEMRYALRRGLELTLDVDGNELRMGFCKADADKPLITWRLGYTSEASYSIKMIRLDQQDQSFERQSHPVELAPPPPTLAARPRNHELGLALAVVQSFVRR